MTELWLIRHAESEHNARGLVQGQADVHLSERGREQAQRLARRLALAPPDVLFASDLRRAFDTAQAIAQACQLPVHPELRLREFDLGRWSGRTWPEIAELYPDDIAQLRHDNPYHRRGGGESKVEVQRRAVAAFHDIMGAHRGQCVALVSHGGTLRTLLSYLLDLPLEEMFHRLRLDNGSLTRVRLAAAGERNLLVSLNDTAHLESWAAL